MRTRQGILRLSFILTLTLMVAACVNRTPTGGTVPLPTSTLSTASTMVPDAIMTDEQLEQALVAEGHGETIFEAMQAGPFAGDFVDRYLKDGRIIVLVTDHAEAVQAFLVDEGVPESAFEVRTVETSLPTLQAVEEAALDWIGESFKGGGGVAIDVEANAVVVAVERERLVELIGYDPGEEPVPYERWPESLKGALEEFVPGVAVELYSGFSEYIQTPREDTAPIP